MTRSELEHAIRAACDVSGDTEVYVIGSQAILGQFPNAPDELRQSIEADIVPKNKPENTDDIDGSLGEFSLFHETHKFYVHGISLEAAILPREWEKRVIKVQNENTRMNIGWCIEGHDLALSKLVAGRDKDFGFVRVLLKNNFVDANELINRIDGLGVEQAHKARISKWVLSTSKELR